MTVDPVQTPKTHPTPPFPSLACPTLPRSTLPYPTLPYSTLPYPTLPYPTIEAAKGREQAQASVVADLKVFLARLRFGGSNPVRLCQSRTVKGALGFGISEQSPGLVAGQRHR